MNNPLLYPFLAICAVFALAFAVWCYFTIKERRRDAERGRTIVALQERDEARQRVLVQASLIAAAVAATPDEVIADDAESAPELPGQPSYGVLYRHHGHRHAKRPRNRADRRAS